MRALVCAALVLVGLAAPASAPAASGLTVTSLVATGTGPVVGGTAHRNEYGLSWSLEAGEYPCEVRAASSVNSTGATSVSSTSASGSVMANPGETITFTLYWGAGVDSNGNTICYQPGHTLTTTATALAYDASGGGGGGTSEGGTATTEPAPPVATMDVTFVGLTGTFTDTSTDPDGNIALVSWSFGDGANGVGAIVEHTYASAGTFTVVQTVTDTTGLAAQATYVLVVAAFGGEGRAVQRKSVPLTRVGVRGGLELTAVYCSSGPRSLTVVGSGEAGLGRGTCRTLERLMKLPRKKRIAEVSRRPGAAARALIVLGHEAGHANGVLGEREATCAAVPQVRRLATALGLGPRLAARVAAAARAQTRRARCAELAP